MLKGERLAGAAIALSVLWITGMVFSIMHMGQPPAGLIMVLLTVAAGTTWWLAWAIPMRRQLNETQAEIRHLQDEHDAEIRHLQEERDVEEAMRRLRPQLRVVHYDR